MKKVLFVAVLLAVIAYAVHAQPVPKPCNKCGQYIDTTQVKHDTILVLRIDADVYKELNYLIGKSNAEHLRVMAMLDYLDYRSKHITIVVDSIMKK